MEGVRTNKGADIAFDHHQLVVVKMKLKLKKHWKTEKAALQKFKTAFPQDTDKLNQLKIAISNRSQALQDILKEETDKGNNWKGIREALTSTCQEILVLKKYYNNRLISIETLDKIQERKNKNTAINNTQTRTEKVKAKAEYTEANKQVKKSIRADKQKYMKELATTAEKAEMSNKYMTQRRNW
ncbi:unnamed protein product [Schistosoma curassoni]|uniref:Flagellar FliJ protein n=1 Tax=Schistosoma curassoni TaxID=6186 RepID=A0A183KPW8_9TREM|nr:unnamed protein product [Schistosoma curassoni]